MEESLWNLEEKWKISTHKAMGLLACASVLVLGVCVAAAALRRRRRRRGGSVHQEPRSALMGSVQWSKSSREDGDGVWQRPILMGEKCELPRYSGLIMYDHKGIPIHHYQQPPLGHNQEMSPAVVTTTLRELL